MALSYNLGYQESISVHPTRRQIFAGKPDSTFFSLWQTPSCDFLGLLVKRHWLCDEVKLILVFQGDWFGDQSTLQT